MKILVTGGAGFIGSHIVDASIDRGHQAVMVDNLLTGFADNVKPRSQVLQDKHLPFRPGDVRYLGRGITLRRPPHLCPSSPGRDLSHLP